MAKNKRRSAIAENWISYPRSMVESPALRVLSRAAILIMHRIELEHMTHGGAENGRLQVTWRQFEEWGVHHAAIGAGIREIVALGFAEITEHGHAGVGGHGLSNRFRLTYVNSKNREQPTNEWQRIATIEEAECIARVARGEKDRRTRDIGTLGGQANKSFFSATVSGGDSATVSGGETRNHKPTVSGGTMLHPRFPGAPSIISVGGGGRGGGHTPSVTAPPPADDAPVSDGPSPLPVQTRSPRVPRQKARALRGQSS